MLPDSVVWNEHLQPSHSSDAAEPSPSAKAPADISVLVITYNHARYVAQALNSVFAQRTSRRVEIIISEDRSTDRTYEIVEELASEHDNVSIIRSQTNLASNAVVLRAISAASGRYICLLDGDDYWIDEGKLERQAALLDAEPQLSAVFHNAIVIDEDNHEVARQWTRADHPALSDASTLWEGNPFATCAGMLRREALEGLGAWYEAFFPITDWPLYLLCARSGPIAFQDFSVGAYRLHTGGQFSALGDGARLDQIERFYDRMAAVLPEQSAAARVGRTRYFFDWARELERDQRYGRALDCLRRVWRAGGVGSAVSSSRFIGLICRSLARRGRWMKAA